VIRSLPSNLRRLTIVAPTWLGDLVMAEPFLRCVKCAFPEACLTLAMRGSLLPIAQAISAVDEAVACPMSGWLGPWNAGRAMARTAPDAIILLPGSFRSALAARCAAAPIRAGFAKDGRRLLLTHAPAAPTTRPLSQGEFYAALAEGLLGRAPDDPQPRLAPPAAARDSAQRILAPLTTRFALLNPGASKPAKRWPIDRFAALARLLHDEHDLSVVVNTAPGEEALLEQLRPHLPPGSLALADQPSMDLSVLLAVVSRAALVVTNDTGTRHLAAATGAPTIVLFGPTDPRWIGAPGPHEHRLVANPFLPAPQLADDHPRACLIDRIPLSDAVAAASALLARGQPAPRPGERN